MRMISRTVLGLAAALTPAAAALSCTELSVGPSSVNYSASLTAGAEIPPPTGSPTATGTSTLVLSSDDVLTVTINIVGQLTSDVTMAHIHGPAATDATAGIVLDFMPAMSSVISAGTRTGTILSAQYELRSLTVGATNVLRVNADNLIAFMNSGQAYVNVHTVTNASGELRGQIVR